MSGKKKSRILLTYDDKLLFNRLVKDNLRSDNKKEVTKAWKKITVDYNCLTKNGRRTEKQLRDLLRNMKKKETQNSKEFQTELLSCLTPGEDATLPEEQAEHPDVLDTKSNSNGYRFFFWNENDNEKQGRQTEVTKIRNERDRDEVKTEGIEETCCPCETEEEPQPKAGLGPSESDYTDCHSCGNHSQVEQKAKKSKRLRKRLKPYLRQTQSGLYHLEMEVKRNQLLNSQIELEMTRWKLNMLKKSFETKLPQQ